MVRNDKKSDNGIRVFYGMILASIISLIFFGIIAFIIGGIIVCIYVIADWIAGLIADRINVRKEGLVDG